MEISRQYLHFAIGLGAGALSQGKRWMTTGLTLGASQWAVTYLHDHSLKKFIHNEQIRKICYLSLLILSGLALKHVFYLPIGDLALVLSSSASFLLSLNNFSPPLESYGLLSWEKTSANRLQIHLLNGAIYGATSSWETRFPFESSVIDLYLVQNFNLQTSKTDYQLCRNSVKALKKTLLDKKISFENENKNRWIIPIAENLHCACIVIEKKNNHFFVTLLDSIPFWEWKNQLQVVKETLLDFFPNCGYSQVRNEWAQNNQMKCGVHLVSNIPDIFAISEESIYQWVLQENAKKKSPSDFFKEKTLSELEQIYIDKIRNPFQNYLRQIPNEETVRYKASSPSFPLQSGTVAALQKYFREYPKDS